MDDNVLREHRRILGLRSNPSADDINAAFRRLSKNAHPDAGGSLDRFTQLQQARTELLEAVDQAGPGVYFAALGRRSSDSGFIDRQPLWLPGALATLVIGIISAVVGFVRVDRQVLAGGVLLAVAVGVAITGVVAYRRHRAH